MSKFKIEFYRDREEDKLDTYSFFKDDDPADWIFRGHQYNMPYHLIKGICDKEEDAKKALYEYMDKEYDLYEEYNLYSMAEENTNKLWDKISEKFSERIFELTNKDLGAYSCLLTMFITTSAWNDSRTIRRSLRQVDYDKYVIAYEVLLSHCFKCVRDYYSEEDIASAWDLWGFAEITATFLFRDKEIIDLLPDFDMPISQTFFADGGYPCLIKPEEDLKKFWKDRKSFKDYIDRSIEYLKKHPIRS